MTNANDTTSTRELGHRVSAEGVAPHREALDALARTALALGIRPHAAAALLDRTSPEVVSERAMAVLAAAMTDWTEDHTEPVFLAGTAA